MSELTDAGAGAFHSSRPTDMTFLPGAILKVLLESFFSLSPHYCGQEKEFRGGLPSGLPCLSARMRPN